MLEINPLSIFSCSSCSINDTKVTLLATWHYAVQVGVKYPSIAIYFIICSLSESHAGTIRGREKEKHCHRQTDMGERDRRTWWSHPQVVFAAERLQQLLVVSVAHLSQKGQQTRHKLSLKG